MPRGRPARKNTPTPPVTERGARTRARLVTAAREVFETEGFINTRIASIARTAQVAYGTFYSHFPSKEAIFMEVASELFEEMFREDPAAEHQDPAKNPRERLERSNRIYYENYKRNSALMAIIEQVEQIDPEFRELRNGHRRLNAARGAAAIAHWQEQGLVSGKIDPRITAFAISSMVDRTLTLQFVVGEDIDGDEVLHTLNELTIGALGISSD